MKRASSRNLAALYFRAAAFLWWLAAASTLWHASDPEVFFLIGNLVVLIGAVYRWVLPDCAPSATPGSASRFHLENSGGVALLKGPKAPR